MFQIPQNSSNIHFTNEDYEPYKYCLRGPGVFDLGKVEIELSVVSNRREFQLPDVFLLNQTILFLVKVFEF